MLFTDSEPTNKSNIKLSQKNADIGSVLSKKAFKALLPKLQNKRILLIGDMPRPNKNLNECAFAEMSSLLRTKCDDSMYKYLDSRQVLAWHKSSDIVLKAMSEQYKNIITIIPSDSLCDSEHCQTYINGELIYKDNNHIRRNLNNKTAIILSQKIGLHDAFQFMWEK